MASSGALSKRHRPVTETDGFFECKVVLGEKRKPPFWLRRRDRRATLIASVYDSISTGEKTETTVALITNVPNELVAQIRDHMLGFVEPNDVREWMNPEGTPEEVAHFFARGQPRNGKLCRSVTMFQTQGISTQPLNRSGWSYGFSGGNAGISPSVTSSHTCSMAISNHLMTCSSEASVSMSPFRMSSVAGQPWLAAMERNTSTTIAQANASERAWSTGPPSRECHSPQLLASPIRSCGKW
ncbi:MAG: hypothetical protein CVV45_00675 [Spirochaetae bacterium HGW-Spirochaetae-10]|nr:MAG: hypothetical protein CVV45_00675 [Spirochaetae bacterium HGW-Spirochaetae-10]